MQKYKKVKTIGKGSFGYAVLVRNVEEKDNLMVMKIIDIEKMSSKQKEEALTEIKCLKTVDNPFIIKYRESFIEKKALCIVMDYADGGNLYTMINDYKARKEYIPETLVLDIFSQICLAIEHVHSKNILHRDLKTQNIFLMKDRQVKLGDFGVSRILQHTYDLAKTAIGTPYYLSPEICQEMPYNHKSDIWSLGCILYEMLSLNHAFDALSMKGLILKILQGNFPSPPSHYSAELTNLLNALLQTNPDRRPSIEEVLNHPSVANTVKNLRKIYNQTPNQYAPIINSNITPSNAASRSKIEYPSSLVGLNNNLKSPTPKNVPNSNLGANDKQINPSNNRYNLIKNGQFQPIIDSGTPKTDELCSPTQTDNKNKLANVANIQKSPLARHDKLEFPDNYQKSLLEKKENKSLIDDDLRRKSIIAEIDKKMERNDIFKKFDPKPSKSFLKLNERDGSFLDIDKPRKQEEKFMADSSPKQVKSFLKAKEEQKATSFIDNPSKSSNVSLLDKDRQLPSSSNIRSSYNYISEKSTLPPSPIHYRVENYITEKKTSKASLKPALNNDNSARIEPNNDFRKDHLVARTTSGISDNKSLILDEGRRYKASKTSSNLDKKHDAKKKLKPNRLSDESNSFLLNPKVNLNVSSINANSDAISPNYHSKSFSKLQNKNVKGSKGTDDKSIVLKPKTPEIMMRELNKERKQQHNIISDKVNKSFLPDTDIIKPIASLSINAHNKSDEALSHICANDHSSNLSKPKRILPSRIDNNIPNTQFDSPNFKSNNASANKYGMSNFNSDTTDVTKEDNCKSNQSISKEYVSKSKEPSYRSSSKLNISNLSSTDPKGLQSEASKTKEESARGQSELTDPPLKSNFLFENLPIKVECNDTLSYKIEALRIYLENVIGLDNFLQLYRGIKDEYLGDNFIEDIEKFLPLVHQLIFLEDKVFGAYYGE